MTPAPETPRESTLSEQLEEAVTVLDEPFHREAMADLIRKAAARITALEEAIRNFIGHNCDEDCHESGHAAPLRELEAVLSVPPDTATTAALAAPPRDP